jgi:hypothetical protein
MSISSSLQECVLLRLSRLPPRHLVVSCAYISLHTYSYAPGVYHHKTTWTWLGWPLWNICVTNDHGYVSLVNTSRSFPHSRLITGFVTRLTRRVPLVEQELLTLPEHLSSPPVFCGVRVTRSLVLYVCFVDRCLSFCTFSFDHDRSEVFSGSSIRFPPSIKLTATI